MFNNCFYPFVDFPNNYQVPQQMPPQMQMPPQITQITQMSHQPLSFMPLNNFFTYHNCELPASEESSHSSLASSEKHSQSTQGPVRSREPKPVQ